MRFAYADPPYFGCCNLYGHFHGDPTSHLSGCWDEVETHRKLVGFLCSVYPDGWAMSLTSTSLAAILPMCPPDARVGAWVKSFCAFKRGVRPAYAWEPLIFWRGRNPSNGHPHPPPQRGGQQTTPKDYIETPITLQKGLTGAKPERFCSWVLDLLGYQDGDEIDDLFPGTGIMARVAAQGRLAV